ncbi:Transcription initiation factor tfiid subunit 13 [Rhynchospora pubera]|uniref:Transcription initiation factor TFIID subunit 13 n=1 Tax=Rhynchospora pubera TaxID=906938 RepID=A0AAV8DKY9_9POAL|nr:Transcription initiation factor tfiid subunit 13 [Rhynchospora pubera]
MQNPSPSPSPSPSPATATGAPTNPSTTTGATTNKGKAPASAAQHSSAEASLKRKRGFFQKDLQHMMYGFGDDANVYKAQNVGSKRGKLLTEDFLYLIRKDLPKFNRCKELLSMNEELKQARKAFDVSEENLATANDQV